MHVSATPAQRRRLQGLARAPSVKRPASPTTEVEEPAHLTRRLDDLQEEHQDAEGDVGLHVVCTVDLKQGQQEVEIATAIEDEIQALDDPIIQKHLLQEYPKEKLEEGMNKEMAMMTEFDVADCVPASSLSESELSSVLDFTWALRWKGSEVRARLCVRGFNQIIKDLDSTFASTPVLIILKLLIVLALAFNWSIFTYDVTTAFLHALLNPEDDPIYVWPPTEYFPFKKCRLEA